MATKNFFSNLLSNPWWCFPAPGTQTAWIIYDNKRQKIRKKLQVLSKNAKIHDGKKLKTIALPLETKQ